MKRADLFVGAVFAAIGIGLIVSGYTFPPGMGRLPGPGFFPGAIGIVTLLLAAALLAGARLADAPASSGNTEYRGVAVMVGLLAVYLLLWGMVPFVIRTPLFVIALLRYTGQSWRAALVVAAVLTVVVLGAFQLGLRVDLG